MSEKNKKKTDKNSAKKTVEAKKSDKKVDPIKQENELLKKKVFNLEMKNLELKSDIEASNKTFLKKIEEMQEEAQKKVVEFKQEHKASSEKELEHIKKYASSKFFTEFIEPLLNLELAIKAGKNQDNPSVNNYVIGFEMLLKQIEGIMENNNVSKIVPNIGDIFNPETMVAVQVDDDKANVDKVKSTKKAGYMMHDRVLKPASVIIGK